MPPRSTNAPYSVMFLMTPLTTLPSSRVSRVLVFCSSRSFSRRTRRDEHDVAALLVELDDLELVGLPDQLVQVADGAKVDLRAGEERLHAAADGDREAALHALADGAFDELVALARGRDLIPHLHLVRFLLGKRDEAVVVLAALDVDVDDVAGLDGDLRPCGVGELAAAAMIPSLLPPMSMTTLSRCTATTVPLTISPSLPNSPAWMLASKRLAKFSAAPAVCSGVLPAEPRAVVVVWVDMMLGRSSVVALRPVCVACTRGLKRSGAGARWGNTPSCELPGSGRWHVACRRLPVKGGRLESRGRGRAPRAWAEPAWSKAPTRRGGSGAVSRIDLRPPCGGDGAIHGRVGEPGEGLRLLPRDRSDDVARGDLCQRSRVVVRVREQGADRAVEVAPLRIPRSARLRRRPARA